MGISFGQRMISLHITRTLFHTQLSYQAHQEQTTIQHSLFEHKGITNPSITHADKVMQVLAECIKAIQGMTGKARNSQAAQDLQRIIDATQACAQTNPHQFEKTITPDHFCNTQQVLRVNTPASMPIRHTNDNR
jgi:hypothetical protein